MTAKYFDIWLRWRPHLTARQERRLERLLPWGGVLVSRDGLEGQSEKDPEELRAVLAAVCRVRGTDRDVLGAIVPRGYGWRPVVALEWHDGWSAFVADRELCQLWTYFRGPGHAPGCGCPWVGNDTNTGMCVVAEAVATVPPLVTTGEGK